MSKATSLSIHSVFVGAVLCCASARASEGIMVTTEPLTFEAMREKCPALEAKGIQDGAPPWCSGPSHGVIRRWDLTQPRSNDCKIIPENGPDMEASYAQNLGDGWRRWLATSFELHGRNCDELHAFARAQGIEADSGWYYLGSPVPQTTYYVSFAYRVRGPAEKTPGIRPSHFPAPGGTVRFEIRVCKHGTPLNNCAAKTSSSGLPEAGQGVVPDIAALASYAAGGAGDASSARLEEMLDRDAGTSRLESMLDQQVKDEEARAEQARLAEVRRQQEVEAEAAKHKQQQQAETEAAKRRQQQAAAEAARAEQARRQQAASRVQDKDDDEDDDNYRQASGLVDAFSKALRSTSGTRSGGGSAGSAPATSDPGSRTPSNTQPCGRTPDPRGKGTC